MTRRSRFYAHGMRFASHNDHQINTLYFIMFFFSEKVMAIIFCFFACSHFHFRFRFVYFKSEQMYNHAN